MAGRIRSVKPEWLEDELLAGASDEARVLSVALILLADDHGNGRAHPAYLAAQVWTYSRDPRESLAKASRALRELLATRFVILYEVGGQHYFAIRNWAKHQKVDHPGKPRIPGPSDGNQVTGITGFFDLSRDPRESSRDTRETLARIHETLAPDLRSPITDQDQHTNVGTGEPGTVPGPLRGAGVSPDGDPEDGGPEPDDDLPDSSDGPEQVALPLGDTRPASPRHGRGRDLPAEAHALYVEGWRANKGKGKAPILDDKRRKLIRARLKDFDAADILDAARGAWASSWWRDNDRNEFDRVFKDSQNVERFRDFWRSSSAQSDDGAALADPNDLPPTAVRYDRLPEPPVFREPRAEVIPSVVFGDDP